MTYKLLVLDTTEAGESKATNAESLMYLIRGNSQLWKSPSVKEGERKITDGDVELVVTALPDADKQSPDGIEHQYVVTLSGYYASIEALREPLASFLKGVQFNLIYVLRDEVSESIACKLYPFLYRIENQLRGYLIRFMATQVGATWWELTASAEMADKAKKRKKNEKIFGKVVENSAYLIDFDELGELVYKQSSGFRNMEDILSRIGQLAETPEAIKSLKKELQSNYMKFFKESFADKGFKAKWTQFEELRNKIAHNNLFTDADLVLGESLGNEIAAIISAADQGSENLQITTEEREAIREQVIARSDTAPPVTQALFLSELAEQESHYAGKPGGFVGASRFINSHLMSRGFAPPASQKVLDELKTSGSVEVYAVPNPADADHPTSALRTRVSSAAIAPSM